MEQFAYHSGEWEGWNQFLWIRSWYGIEIPLFKLTCSRGHKLDSPIDLPVSEVGKRCIECGARR
jgi:hypothetical protein